MCHHLTTTTTRAHRCLLISLLHPTAYVIQRRQRRRCSSSSATIGLIYPPDPPTTRTLIPNAQGNASLLNITWRGAWPKKRNLLLASVARELQRSNWAEDRRVSCHFFEALQRASVLHDFMPLISELLSAVILCAHCLSSAEYASERQIRGQRFFLEAHKTDVKTAMRLCVLASSCPEHDIKDGSFTQFLKAPGLGFGRARRPRSRVP